MRSHINQETAKAHHNKINTGADGVHYSLLTDFGKTTNMEEAPVI